jgi:hypothetical protein
MKNFYAFKGYQVVFWVLLGVLMACSPAPTQPKVVRIEITPGALLLTKAGESQTLSAKAFDAQGNEIKTNFAWSSSNTAHATVDTSGKVVAVSALGSAQITAEAAGVKSSPALVIIAEPAPGTVLVSDAQVLGEPQPVDPSQPGGVGYRMKATLAIQSLQPGTMVFASESKPLAGRVVSSTPVGGGTEVVFEVRPVNEMFRNLSVRVGGAFTGVRPSSAQKQQFPDYKLSERQKVVPQATDQVGPFTCKREVEGKLESNLVEVEPSASLGNWDIIFEVSDSETTHIRVKADLSVGISFTGGTKLSNMLNGTVSCETTEPIFSIPVPITGALSQIISPILPVHGAFGIKGELALTSVDLRLKGEIKASATVGFEYTPATGLTNLSSFDTNQNFLKGSLVEPVFGLNSKVRVNAEGFLGFRPKLSFGNRLFALDFLDLDVVGALGFDLSTVAQQATDAEYASSQYLKIKAETSLSDDIEDVFSL